MVRWCLTYLFVWLPYASLSHSTSLSLLSSFQSCSHHDTSRSPTLLTPTAMESPRKTSREANLVWVCTATRLSTFRFSIGPRWSTEPTNGSSKFSSSCTTPSSRLSTPSPISWDSWSPACRQQSLQQSYGQFQGRSKSWVYKWRPHAKQIQSKPCKHHMQVKSTRISFQSDSSSAIVDANKEHTATTQLTNLCWESHAHLDATFSAERGSWVAP